MNYFQPDVLVRCRSRDDDVAEAAAREWEKGITAYQARLRAIRNLLPAGARKFNANVALHDAELLGVAFGKRRPRVRLLLRLAGAGGQPGEMLELTYGPVRGPNGGVAFQTHPQLGSSSPQAVWVLYDELDLDEERAFFTHRLLLSDGREVEIRFHTLQVRYLEEVVSPLQLTAIEKKWQLV